jgi:nitrous oxide reductase accessory protein NosL
MTKSLLLSVAALAALAVAACAEDGQTTERGIDQDITATHYAGAAVLDNVGPRAVARQRGAVPPPGQTWSSSVSQ